MIESIKNNNFEFKKKFGQNFIFDTNLLTAIVKDAGITKEDVVLEIGVGAGTLTREICKAAKYVYCYEIDTDLEPIIRENVQEKNYEVVFKDFMKVENSEIEKNTPNGFKVVANLPYYITTPIIFKLLEIKTLKSLSIMVQKEVAERIIAKPGTKNYGTITAQIDAIGEASITRIVNRKMFCPEPNVDSAIVKIDIKPNKFDIENYSLLKRVIDCAFAMRRKTLSNNLKSTFGLSAEQIDLVCKNVGILPSQRGETLTTSQFVLLTKELNKIVK